MNVCFSVYGVASALLLVAACTPVVKEGPAHTVMGVETGHTDANEAVVRRSFQAREQGDVATLNELSDPDEMLHPPGGPAVRRGGPYTELKDLCPMCAALEHRKFRIDMMLAKGDLVYVRSTWTGSEKNHDASNSWLGFAAATRAASLSGCSVQRPQRDCRVFERVPGD